jgi:hypothetical protein
LGDSNHVDGQLSGLHLLAIQSLSAAGSPVWIYGQKSPEIASSAAASE